MDNVCELVNAVSSLPKAKDKKIARSSQGHIIIWRPTSRTTATVAITS